MKSGSVGDWVRCNIRAWSSKPLAFASAAFYSSAMFRYLRTKWVFPFLLATVAISAGVWAMAWRAALSPLSEQAASELALASDQLTRHLFRYRELAVVLAEHPVLRDRLGGKADGSGNADRLLQAMADMTGAHHLSLVAPDGKVLAASGEAKAQLDPRAPLIHRALTGALGAEARFQPVPRRPTQRIFSFAAPMHGAADRTLGAVVARTDLLDFEENWPSTAAALFFTLNGKRIFAANRSELVNADRPREGFLKSSASHWTGHEVWTMDAGPYLPDRALHLTRDLPVIGLTGEILLDTAPAERTAALLAGIAAAICLGIGALLLAVGERRRALNKQLRLKAAANARLESRVAERTKALSTANADLLRENRERREAEAALKQAQADLVQAGKLAALGEMSAGISHELNQPLMAIRSFADNGTVFLQRGQADKAGQNLGRISQQAGRMDRIIKNLRAFARQESEPITDVDLVQVVDQALEMLAPRIKADRVNVEWAQPHVAAWVRGGEVRLQQVVMNLMSNGMDAMADRVHRKIEISLVPSTDRVILSVRDTGPGIDQPDRLFDPFYTTKQVSATEGMGLGLSISYGLVQSFGGAIRGRNHPDGGAVFTVELDRAHRQEVA
ncbi:ATP-binding protein [uncultured Aliiroseovarius sp.]|uniref:sensor histidine kinase n=2 Tax=Aliiroseovarius TaxID=1658781 RepID=UPI00259416B8|nr:ATP-binding protein [uncultured Aliiroseovarius sp.]